MRVLAYADSVEFSGAERAFALVVAELADRPDYDLTAAVPDGALSDELRRAVSSVHALPRVAVRAGLSAFDPRLRRAAAAAARACGAEVALVNLPSSQAGTSGLLAGVPTVAFLHVAASLADAGFRLGAARDRLAGPRLRRAVRIVVPAPSVRRYLWERWGFPAERVGWAPPPFRALEPVERSEARRALGVGGDRRLVGIIGRVSVKQKGHDVLLRALAELDPDVSLLVAGTGRDSDRVRALARSLGLAERVSLLGPVGRPELLYGAVDALAIPSRFEGLPLVALEALSLGAPGVAAAVDGLADVWPAKWLVPAGDAHALARALAELLEGDRARLRDRTRAHWREVEPRFGRGSGERFARELELAREAV